jgi:SAM-dependent methyltransferase
MSDLNVREYWEERLAASWSLEGVGWQGLGEPFNRWMYAVRGRVFDRAVRRWVALRPDLRVLDVGSGTGFYLERWQKLGVPRPEGSDLTETAVDRLAAGHPGLVVHRFDAGGPPDDVPGRRFEAISAMDVLFHIVDDAAYARALENLARLLVAGGILLWSDNFVHAGAAGDRRQSSRTLGDIEALLERAGLRPLERRPMFVLMNTPIDSSSRALRAWWEGLAGVASKHAALGWAAGAAVYPLELALVRALPEGPSTELMVCRREA